MVGSACFFLVCAVYRLSLAFDVFAAVVQLDFDALACCWDLLCLGGMNDEAGSSEKDPDIALAKQILAIVDDDEAILSVLGKQVTRKTPVEELRKIYLNISRKIHPDKLERRFKGATKAFQCLVQAFERLCQPDLTSFNERDAKAMDKQTKISRSNDGCYKTSVRCPRCHDEWGAAVSGLEKAAYTWMMTGIKVYNCASCLLDFGCMTAEHKCPHCRKSFDYDVKDYHRKIVCRNLGCTKEFGFWLFEASDRRLRELKVELKDSQEKYLKKQAVARQRQERQRKRDLTDSRSSNQIEKDEEKVFLMGLSLNCPRCGEHAESNDLAAEHLRGCTNKKKHAAYQAEKEKKRGQEFQKTMKKATQEETQNLKTWEFLGSKAATVWMLTDQQLQTKAVEYKLDVDKNSGREAIIGKLVKKLNTRSDNLLMGPGESGGDGGGKRGGGGEGRLLSQAGAHEDDLPSNLWDLTVAQLRGLCAVYGVKTDSQNKSDIIKALEKDRFGNELLLLEDQDEKKRKKAEKKADGAWKRDGDEQVGDDDGDDSNAKKKPKKSHAKPEKKEKKEKKKTKVISRFLGKEFIEGGDVDADVDEVIEISD